MITTYLEALIHEPLADFSCLVCYWGGVGGGGSMTSFVNEMADKTLKSMASFTLVSHPVSNDACKTVQLLHVLESFFLLQAIGRL